MLEMEPLKFSIFHFECPLHFLGQGEKIYPDSYRVFLKSRELSLCTLMVLKPELNVKWVLMSKRIIFYELLVNDVVGKYYDNFIKFLVDFTEMCNSVPLYFVKECFNARNVWQTKQLQGWYNFHLFSRFFVFPKDYIY